ncbi:MAG TPA: DoxX family protein [Microvirga sp.]|nr:DoxX family protein [Microvirga sp.]
MTEVHPGARSLRAWLVRSAHLVAPPLLRVALAVPFLRSGLTKWDGLLSLSPAAVFLFEEEFKLHVFGRTYDLPAPGTLALLTGVAEIVLPVLLILGLATRLSALALLVMTAVIQLVVPEGWANFHLPWAALAVAILALGPGPLSVDHLIGWFTQGHSTRRRAPEQP